MNSPFKFLDSYTKEDKDIFFGRDREIEELYQKVFESKILLLYGVSGTGKSSLIDCGLGNKIADSDWLPVNVRRGSGMVESLWRQLCGVDLSGEVASHQSPVASGVSGKDIVKKIKSVYLDHFKPIYLIFDQLEELFIFGSREEQQEFVAILKTIVEADVQCKILISLRAEYLADITRFEGILPDIIENRMRIEKISRTSAMEVISGPCIVSGIALDEGFEESLMSKLVPEGKEVELTYLQVYLDKIFKLSADSQKFTLEQIGEVGDVSDLLGSFLEEQIGILDDPDKGLIVLKAFVSMQGTKKLISEEEISDFVHTLGQQIELKELTDLLNRFVNLRVLKDKNEQNQFELRHDSLAIKIFEKITLVEKELLEIKHFLDNAFSNFERREIYLNEADLKYIAPYEAKLFLHKRLQKFIIDSKNELVKSSRRRRRVIATAAILLMTILTIFTVWAMRERVKAMDQSEIAEEQRKNASVARQEAVDAQKRAEDNEKMALESKEEAEIAKEQALNARQIAIEELYDLMKPSITISATKMNVFYRGIPNPISVSASGIAQDKLLITTDNGTIQRIESNDLANNLLFYPGPTGGQADFIVKGITNFGDTLDYGSMRFRVVNLPNPVARISGLYRGTISLAELLRATGIDASADNFLFQVEYEVVDFSIRIYETDGSIKRTIVTEGNKFTSEHRAIFASLENGQRLTFENIRAYGPDGVVRDVNIIDFEIFNLNEIIIDLIRNPESFYFVDQLIEVLNQLELIEDNLIEFDSIYSDEEIDSLHIRIHNKFLSLQVKDALIKAMNFYSDNCSSMDSLSLRLRYPEKMTELCERIISEYPDDNRLRIDIAQKCNNISFDLLLKKEFLLALNLVELALEADSSYEYAYTNLPLAYLLNNQFENAREVYENWKDKPFVSEANYETFREVFLLDIADLESQGITHPDFAKISVLLE